VAAAPSADCTICIYPLPTRSAGLGIGGCTEILLRVSASLKDCCTAGGAPSPTWQQGAITITFSFWLATPSLAAVRLAAPPPTAFTTAVPLLVAVMEAVMVTTRLLVVLQDTGRSVSAPPVELVGVAVRVLPTAAPLSCTLETGGRMTGTPPGVYCRTPPSKVWRWSPLERTISCVTGRPRLPAGPLELTYKP